MNTLNLPNAITIFRVFLIPVIIYLLARQSYGLALVVFMTAAVSDALDGLIARRFHLQTRFGATLDPIADKLTMLSTTVLLALNEALPVWLAVAIVLRDVVIASGALAYHFLIGRVEMAPMPLSKVNTALEFLVLSTVLAHAAGLLDAGDWLHPLFVLVGATVIVTGAQYVWVWGWKAARAARERH